eukprot:s2341_g5.t1
MKLVSLEIDMNLQVVCTSSELGCVGRSIGDLLSSEGVDLLERCWLKAMPDMLLCHSLHWNFGSAQGIPVISSRAPSSSFNHRTATEICFIFGELPFCYSAAPEGSIAEHLVGPHVFESFFNSCA